MIGPSGGGGFIPLYTLLWMATLCCLGIAGIVAARRMNKGDWMRRGPVMNRTVRFFGVLAAVCFVGYWFANADRRHIEAAFDDVVEVVDVDNGGGTQAINARGLCPAPVTDGPMLLMATQVEHALGEIGEIGVPRAAVAELEQFGVRLEADGWSIRRFVGEDEVRLWGQRDGSFVLFWLQPSPSSRYSLSVTTAGCLGRGFLPLDDSGGLQDNVEEVAAFAP